MKRDYGSIINKASRTLSEDEKRKALVSAGIVNDKTGKTVEKYKAVYCYKK